MDEWNKPEKTDWKQKWLKDEREVPTDAQCSFCKKRRDQVRRLIPGVGGLYICDERVALYREHIEKMAGPPISGIKMSRICSFCEIRVPANHRYCYNCGAQLPKEVVS
jgi:ATP-dependent protease Clp ATPase subunit